jgi:tetratricopeptide (TPR) repeat protein
LRWVRRRPAAAGLLAAVVLLLLVGGVGAWLQYRRWTAARDRQAQTNRDVRGVLESARGALEEGWPAQDLAKLTAALAEGNRAVDIARSGVASAAVQQEAEAFRTDADQRLGRVKKNGDLRDAVLDVAAPQEGGTDAPDGAGRLAAPAQPSVDEQYAAAFRRGGLDVDGTAEAEGVARLGAEPDAVVQELISALDGWMLERRRLKRPEPGWRRLFRVAEQLDHSERRRWLRSLLVGASPPRAASVAALVGTGSSWPALWELARGADWRQLQEVRREIEPRTDPVLTVVLLAQAYAVVGDAAGAEQLLRAAATARPQQVVLLDALGKLLERQGASRLGKPDQIEWLDVLGKLPERQGASRLGRAIEYYRAARAQRPRLGIALSRALVRAGRAEEAEGVLRDLLRLQGESPTLQNDLGVCLDAQKKHAAAEAAYRQALALAPDFVDAHCNLGMCLADQQRYEEAEGACRRAIALRPDRADAHYNLGHTLHKQKNHAAAEAAYRQALALRPDWTEAYYNLGNELNGQGKLGDAEAAYRQAIAHRPDYALAYNNLGLVLSQQQKPGAEAAFRQAIAHQPDLAEAHYNLGNALSQQQKPGAEAAYRQAIALRPDFALAHFTLAYVLGEQGRFAEAQVHAKQGNAVLPAGHPLREEARQLLLGLQRYLALDPRLPALLCGTDKPANPAEQIEVARLCRIKKLYAAAAHFYDDAFTAEPKLGEDLSAGNRYDAACAAALAGCGHGKDADKLDEKECARWRRQAREWLWQDLTWWDKALPSANAETKHQLRLRMRYWQTDGALAGLREPSTLSQLPPDERKECLALWQEVAALLGRVQIN